MIWTVRIQKQDAIVLKVADDFLARLFSRVRDAYVKNLDPYGDATLDQVALVRWRDELGRVEAEIRSEVQDRLTRARGLPRESAAREAVLREWIERELAADEHFQALLEVEAAVILALEVGGVIEAIGD